jgi:hypothetical protein
MSVGGGVRLQVSVASEKYNILIVRINGVELLTFIQYQY